MTSKLQTQHLQKQLSQAVSLFYSSSSSSSTYQLGMTGLLAKKGLLTIFIFALVIFFMAWLQSSEAQMERERMRAQTGYSPLSLTLSPLESQYHLLQTSNPTII